MFFSKRQLPIIVNWVLVLSILSSSAALAQCPSPDKVLEGFRKTYGRDVKVLKVEASAMPSLCEVQMSLGGRNEIMYSDPEGKFFVMGPLFDAQKGVNLTQQALALLNRLSDQDMKRLESLVAFSSGSSEKVIYYVTDPQCPYCTKGLETLKKLIEEGKVMVKFVLYPLPMHKEAEAQCVAIICDKKGLEGLESKYQSENQCAEGIEKVRNTVAFLKEKSVSGTPTYIFPDGIYHVGLMPPEALLGEQSAAKSPE
jgi:thiol:disulfide interchange protein DsbC